MRTRRNEGVRRPARAAGVHALAQRQAATSAALPRTHPGPRPRLRLRCADRRSEAADRHALAAARAGGRALRRRAVRAQLRLRRRPGRDHRALVGGRGRRHAQRHRRGASAGNHRQGGAARGHRRGAGPARRVRAPCVPQARHRQPADRPLGAAGADGAGADGRAGARRDRGAVARPDPALHRAFRLDRGRPAPRTGGAGAVPPGDAVHPDRSGRVARARPGRARGRVEMGRHPRASGQRRRRAAALFADGRGHLGRLPRRDRGDEL